ncbi:MAG: DUF542 domain-containing protein [Chitinophagaceae bacterium]|nr:DUF542 domain-containing protein [Chitinophagaceae bacterium]MBK8953020.1 DUF542 domain-containing protein [Chitinophagaceae bacterium]
MFLHSVDIQEEAMVADIVASDYRTADVFSKYGIEYNHDGNLPLFAACQSKGLDSKQVISDLKVAVRETNMSNSINYNDWHIDFLTDYIVNVHHQYLRNAILALNEYIDAFVREHKNQFSYLIDLQRLIAKMNRHFTPHMKHEEEIIFPYIRQIAHAYYSKESYASLLVRTLRKPIEDIVEQEHELIADNLKLLREITNTYSLPSNASLSHKVAFLKLKEIDTDLVQHMFLENEVLFPRALAMEKELLAHND